jgi:7-cyano-7-deazaguanine synthase
MELEKALVLLSGGIDSTTALYLTKQETDDIYSMNMVYTQSFDSEAEAAKKLAKVANVKDHFSVYLPFFKYLETLYHPAVSSDVSTAYVPARNIVFYGVATAYAETIGATRIIFGSNQEDAKELPDARPEFIELMNELVRIGTRSGTEGSRIEIVNPLINYNKVEVLKLALKLKVPLELTWSCYQDLPTPCGKCRGCQTRRKAFDSVGIHDPLDVSSRPR